MAANQGVTDPAGQPPAQPDKPADSSPQPPSAAEAAPAQSKPEPGGPPIVGIGASAGGLDAFKRFFAAMPADSGIAFVLVPHLDPAHKSLMVELLARHTAMPVVEAEHHMTVEANRVYIIPPDKYMTIHAGVLGLIGPVERHASQTTIDHFLRSLADDQQERAICIILSGTGAHGTLGLKAVKAAGGVAMVQDPATAEYDRMPLSAIATGLADYVLPVEQMPEALVQYVQHAYVNGRRPGEQAPESTDSLTRVLALLRARTNFDFGPYRKKMLSRRVERRMGLNHLDSIPKYLAFLRDHPDEVKLLLKDLFISVTSFFRDPEAFEELASQVIAPLVQSKGADDVIRVWVPGCATGEEAYSLVIVLLEQLAAAGKHCTLQVFATDVDRDALDVARRGTYAEAIAADVTPERLARYFTRVDETSYQVSKQVREPVTFAVQNLIGDAPFSRMDLISCRNLLIYLEPDVQQKLLTLLHFALTESGYLFLGPSETIGRQTELFESVSRKWRIFRRIGPARPERVEFPIVAGALEPGEASGPGAAGGELPRNYAELTRRLVLENLGVAAVLVNRKYEILYVLGPTGRYLEMPTGEPTTDLVAMAREGLRTRLRPAVHQVARDNEPVVLTDVKVKRNGHYGTVAVTIRPVPSPRSAQGLLLITFQDQPEAAPAPPASTSEEPLVHQLENELRATKEDLQTTIEEVESSNEELKASNEEIMSMNEELQSANEELETSKEELQSLNEELNTVNSQLQDKVRELESANNDMANPLVCTDVATIFLSRDFHIKRFTPAATRLFNFVATDLGRPLGDITARFSDPNLLADAGQVLRQLTPLEKEIPTAEGHWWLRRILPYRTRDDRIEGVVITFVDVTERKRESDTLVRRLAAIVESSADAIFSEDLDGTIRTWNPGAERLYGYTPDEAVGRSIKMVVPEDRLEELNGILARLGRGEYVALETERLCKDGRRVPVAQTLSPIRDMAGQVVSASVIVRDVGERKRAEQEMRERQQHLLTILTTAVDAILTTDVYGTIASANPATEKMFGYSAAELIGKNVKVLMPAPYRDEHDGYLARYLRTGEKHIIGIGREVQGRRKDGSSFPVDLAVSEFEDRGQRMFTGVLRDLSARKELEREVLEVATVEQQRIGQELHDTSAQELTALGLLAESLLAAVKVEAPGQVPIAGKMAEGLKRVLNQVRAVSRGLIRVEVDAEGLMAALAELAAQTRELHGINCTFDCPRPVHVADNHAATQLYCIAREAVTNALKHSQARNIRISLGGEDQAVTLRVQDDGVGLSEPPLDTRGMGMKIMRYRAGLIDAHLSIGPAEPGGAVVTCKCNKGVGNGQE
jgi:two-component system, chemotaxis family, CheB/CheR fusion protein